MADLIPIVRRRQRRQPSRLPDRCQPAAIQSRNQIAQSRELYRASYFPVSEECQLADGQLIHNLHRSERRPRSGFFASVALVAPGFARTLRPAPLQHETPIIHLGKIRNDREPQARAGWFVQAFARCTTLSSSGTERPGPSSSTSTIDCLALASLAPDCISTEMTTLSSAHLQALSSRLPTISCRSCFLPRNLASGGHSTIKLEIALGIDARQRVGEEFTVSLTSVTPPRC